MLNANTSYPYPVLRPEAIDYTQTVFDGTFSVEAEADGYVIKPSFSVSAGSVQELIANGKAEYAVQINCNATWYRTLIPIIDNKEVKIRAQQVRGRVDICPCIIAVEDLHAFSDSDFAGGYANRSYEIKRKSVLGIADEKSFAANYEEDIIKDASSIIEVSSDSKNKYLDIDFEGHLIQVRLPEKQFDVYKDVGSIGNQGAISVFNAVIAVPAIAQAINIIQTEEDPDSDSKEHTSYSWYKSLKALLEESAGHDTAKYHEMLAKPIQTAQQILNDNSGAVFDYVKGKEGTV